MHFFVTLRDFLIGLIRSGSEGSRLLPLLSVRTPQDGCVAETSGDPSAYPLVCVTRQRQITKRKEGSSKYQERCQFKKKNRGLICKKIHGLFFLQELDEPIGLIRFKVFNPSQAKVAETSFWHGQ